MFYLLMAAPLVLVALGLFIQKVAMKGRLERSLGRKVADEELVSFNACMKVTPTDTAKKPTTGRQR